MVYDAISEIQPIQLAKDQPSFIQTPYVKDLLDRSSLYLKAGYPLHFCGPSGTGKTTLAMYVAAQMGRPVLIIHGDEEFVTSDLVGGEFGYRRKKVVDNFIHSVLKTDESVQSKWMDNRLTAACKNGFSLLYDEFTRSRPEANNILLSVLEERILDLPGARNQEGYLKVHPDFSVIFTSNPQEYAGVHKSQDALRDRMITIKLGHYDRETEVEITCAKSGSSRPDAEKIVDIVRDLRMHNGDGHVPTVRAAIMLARVMKLSSAQANAQDNKFVQTCLDILDSEMKHKDKTNGSEIKEKILKTIKKIC
jgi:gas vesicle protein GvpN